MFGETDPQTLKISSRDGINYNALNTFEGVKFLLLILLKVLV